MSGYPAFDKIPRFNRDVVVTEKIDGTNGLIAIGPQILVGEKFSSPAPTPVAVLDDTFVYAGSRNRWLTTQADNYGFGRWVADNGVELAATLGPGLHYGEWWGSGIQRGYDLPKGEKRFSLFNVSRWGDFDLGSVPGLAVVPSITKGNARWIDQHIEDALYYLRTYGSLAARGFRRPEGIVIYHTAARQSFKVTLENDERPKGV